MCVYVCVCMCVREREGEKETEEGQGSTQPRLYTELGEQYADASTIGSRDRSVTAPAFNICPQEETLIAASAAETSDAPELCDGPRHSRFPLGRRHCLSLLNVCCRHNRGTGAHNQKPEKNVTGVKARLRVNAKTKKMRRQRELETAYRTSRGARQMSDDSRRRQRATQRE